MKRIPVKDLQVGQKIVLKGGPKKIIHISKRYDFNMFIIYWRTGFIRVKLNAKIEVENEN